jgi:benzodiazapine receptor
VRKMTYKTDYLKLVSASVICLSMVWVNSSFSITGKGQWYDDLVKPSFTPPGIVFSIVWPALYILMGTAVFLIWNKGFESYAAKIAIAMFFFQLLLNGTWSVIFFGMHNVGAAMIEIILLWVAIAVCTIKFFAISNLAGALMVPYLVWVAFAAVLNVSIWFLNR